jgi:hypothetical protein
VSKAPRTHGFVLLALCTAGIAGIAGAADSAIVTEARRVLAALESGDAPSPVVKRAVDQAKQALERADALGPESAPKYREVLQQTALDWAEVGRDLKRALAAEQASDALETELSKVQTDLVRTHAAVEQAMARLGRAREEIRTLQGSARAAAAPAPSVETPASEPAEAPASIDEAIGD